MVHGVSVCLTIFFRLRAAEPILHLPLAFEHRLPSTIAMCDYYSKKTEKFNNITFLGMLLVCCKSYSPAVMAYLLLLPPRYRMRTI
ncbi:hypothetical protein XELAEV_18033203mg [Xenopus laevis]|uniref:Secreted protein n=1 Tax=Xenopus laevis TaxID=8355 RepID=A0A974CIV9_XENLA|nr:hypothetical protein XELAEV_18033203mg [Xenopus laevis]